MWTVGWAYREYVWAGCGLDVDKLTLMSGCQGSRMGVRGMGGGWEPMTVVVAQEKGHVRLCDCRVWGREQCATG